MFDLLQAEAAQVGWPRLFQTDLTVHDRQALAGRRAGRFVWVLRDASRGTHIYFLEPAANCQAADWHVGLLRYHQRHERCRWYVGDLGRRDLTPTTAEEAIRLYLAAQPSEQPATPAPPWQPDWAGLLASRGATT